MGRLEILAVQSYIWGMSNPHTPTRDEILADLDASDADLEAGRVVSADDVHRMIQDRIDRYEARRLAADPRPKAARHR